MRKLISNVIFTRNRPLQLEVYLRSLYRHYSEDLIQAYVIYKVDMFDEQYSEVFKRFSDCIVIREQDFHDDFTSLIERIDTKYILFATDDVVYYDSVNFAVIDETFGRFCKDIFGFSLRLDRESLRKENEVINEVEIGSENIYRVNWKRARSRNAKYPFELNSTIYTASLVRRILEPVAREHPVLKKIFERESFLVKSLGLIFHMKDFLAVLDTFHDPNTLEGYCSRWCKTHKRKFPSYLYFQKLCASAVQVNRVNTTIDNPTDGSKEHTVEALNEKYKQGYRFDIEAIEKNKPETTHVGRKYFKLRRIFESGT